MDAQKASYSIALMAKVLGVTRAGYYAWKNRAPQRGKRASARRRLDEAVAWGVFNCLCSRLLFERIDA